MKRTAFKPPRPAKAPEALRPAKRKKASARPRKVLTSSDESSPSDDIVQQPWEDEVTEATQDEVAGSEEVAPSIPPALVNRLVHHFLEERLDSREMRVDKAAMPVIHKYIETFVREAVARAAMEHQLELEAKRARGEDSGFGDDFLEVEDLEKLAPQLLLDF